MGAGPETRPGGGLAPGALSALWSEVPDPGDPVEPVEPDSLVSTRTVTVLFVDSASIDRQSPEFLSDWAQSA